MRLCRAVLVAATIFADLMTAVKADAVRKEEWIVAALRLPAAHRLSEGSEVTVALIDTGVSRLHPDLYGNVLPGIDLSNGVPEGDGLTDVDGHGTAMAALIAAHGHGTADGILGVAPAAKILPIRNGAHKSVYLAMAIDWAVKHGARVISISTGQREPDAGLVAAVNRALIADVVVVAAAGDRPRDNQVLFPAALPGVLAVGGTDRGGNRAAVSVMGPEMLVVAPAVDIISDTYDGGYATVTGTSAATAIVAGAVALVRSRFPYLSAPEVIRRLEITASDRGPRGRDEAYGYGLLDLVAALSGSISPAPTGSPPQVVSPAPTRLRNSASGLLSPGRSEGAHGSDSSNHALAGTLLLIGAAALGGGIVLSRVRKRANK